MNEPGVAVEPPAGLEVFTAAGLLLLDPVAGALVLALELALDGVLAGLLDIAVPLAELAGALEPLPAAVLPAVSGWLPELAWVDDPPEHPCRANTPTTAIDPIIVEVRRNISRFIPPLTQ